jgi:hypothetical protein
VATKIVAARSGSKDAAMYHKRPGELEFARDHLFTIEVGSGLRQKAKTIHGQASTREEAARSDSAANAKICNTAQG